MLKLLLVDDQQRELDGIQRLLDWNALGLEIAGTARNGSDGMRLAKELQPDLVITDVIMPDMDGLSLIQELHETIPDIRVICISCFDDFKFVSMAINRGASGYVLKPVLARELEEVVCRVVADIQSRMEERVLLQKYRGMESEHRVWREALGLRLLQGGLSQREIRNILPATGWQDCFAVACIGYRGAWEELRGQLPECVYCVQKLGQELFCLLPGREKGGLEEWQSFFRSSALWPGLQAGNIWIGVSRDYPALRLPKAVEEAKQAFQYAPQSRDGIHVWPCMQTCSPGCGPDQLRLEIKELLIRRERGAVQSFLEGRLPDGPVDQLRKTASIVWMLAVEEFALDEDMDVYALYGQVERFYTKQEAVIWFQDLFHRLLETGRESNGHSRMIVGRIQEYIKMHLAEGIQLREILKDFYISTGYANLLFKNETGLTIHQYVVRQRMEAAAEMLQQSPNVKIYDVASAVGYADVAYFTNAFKKAFGCTPTQYVLRQEKKGE